MSKISPKYITLVIPVKNEEGNITRTLKSIKKNLNVSHKIIVVDGRSTDATFSLVKKYIVKNRNVSIIRTTPEKSAFKESLEVGIKAAKSEFIAIFMGDLSDSPKTLNKMYKKALAGADVVVGSRYMKGGATIGRPKFQHLFSWSISKSLHLLTGIPTHDVSNPLRLYRKSLLESIKTESRANEVPIEIIFKAYFMGAKISEVPTVWRGRTSGKSKFRMFKVLPGYARLYLWVLVNSWKHNISRLFS